MHVIRLRGPWRYEVLHHTHWLADGTVRTAADNLPPPGQVEMPCDWRASLGADFRGRVRYTRRFGRPTNLERHDRVDLVVGCIDAFGDITLNERHLASVPPATRQTRLDVTPLLEARNELVIEAELPLLEIGAPSLPRLVDNDAAGGLIGIVALEISAT